jgi:hypothetical protein
MLYKYNLFYILYIFWIFIFFSFSSQICKKKILWYYIDQTQGFPHARQMLNPSYIPTLKYYCGNGREPATI